MFKRLRLWLIRKLNAVPLEATPLFETKQVKSTVTPRDLTCTFTLPKEDYPYVYNEPNAFYRHMVRCICERFTGEILPYLDINDKETEIGTVYTATLTVIPRGGNRSYVSE